ncbi:hypothetical protein ATANTOWER_022597 [Ataeniobius toweri]|uniref:Uncharacterized protein n=1 Tax=Ataeniobius toweri TaxID=208326 RepID=A0ABU7BH36_9TELE|nr:hypothetical protein [Ataeniobius toweri]
MESLNNSQNPALHLLHFTLPLHQCFLFSLRRVGGDLCRSWRGEVRVSLLQQQQALTLSAASSFFHQGYGDYKRRWDYSSGSLASSPPWFVWDNRRSVPQEQMHPARIIDLSSVIKEACKRERTPDTASRAKLTFPSS